MTEVYAGVTTKIADPMPDERLSVDELLEVLAHEAHDAAREHFGPSYRECVWQGFSGVRGERQEFVNYMVTMNTPAAEMGRLLDMWDTMERPVAVVHWYTKRLDA
jgi:hypothetical protein